MIIEQEKIKLLTQAQFIAIVTLEKVKHLEGTKDLQIQVWIDHSFEFWEKQVDMLKELWR